MFIKITEFEGGGCYMVEYLDSKKIAHEVYHATSTEAAVKLADFLLRGEEVPPFYNDLFKSG